MKNTKEPWEANYEHETTSSAREASPPPLCTLLPTAPVKTYYSTTARAPVKAGAASQCPLEPEPATTAIVMDSWRWNRLCLSMNASTVRRNSSASSAPHPHARASRADTDDRRRPFSDSDRRSSGVGGGDAARLSCSTRGPIFSDLLRLGARACLLTRATAADAACSGLSSNAVPVFKAAAAGSVAGAAGSALKASSEVAGGGGVIGVPANEEGKLSLAAAGAASCGGGAADVLVAAAVLVCWPLEEEEAERSCRDSARRRSTMAFPRTKTKRALRRSDPASRSAAAAADGTRDDDQERNATSARSSPTRSIRYSRRSRSAAPAAAMAVVGLCQMY